KMKKVLKNKKAFTLTEMIVVIAIIGILAGVLIPTITGYIKRANQSAATQEATAMFQVYETWETEYEARLTDKEFDDYYFEIGDEDLDEDTVYIEYSKTPTGEKDSALNFVYVKGEVVVIINLEDKSQSVDEVDYLDQDSSIFEDLAA
ncbi:MAG: type II secretion system protein, partial [Bacilli bacterium]|nr:type II secretion system protein [Bacilli bacterium]